MTLQERKQDQQQVNHSFKRTINTKDHMDSYIQAYRILHVYCCHLFWDFVASNLTLKFLDLSWNHLRRHGARVLVESICVSLCFLSGFFFGGGCFFFFAYTLCVQAIWIHFILYLHVCNLFSSYVIQQILRNLYLKFQKPLRSKL